MKYNIIVAEPITNMYLRIMELREGKVKIKIKDKTLNKQTTRVLPCRIDGLDIYIESLQNKKAYKKPVVEVVRKKLPMKEVTWEINNKEIGELKKIYGFEILTFRKGGIAGKYVIDVEIEDIKTKKKIKKDFFCSISKREQQKFFLHLAHLEPKELEIAFKPTPTTHGSN